MSADELATFLGEQPTGAICVTDTDDRLLALPARVVRQEDDRVQVEVDALAGPFKGGTPACVVAERFPLYQAIRGVIMQGSISPAGQAAAPAHVIGVEVARTITFSFANTVSDEEYMGGPTRMMPR
ncbi:hypothetical protein [Mycolicibacter senuensis]|uniref:hypothetical protein n=1 Tax=Mycolicibacter senuensis TaxID=386913 RepID=UPI000DCE2142|nr:hypothetical protein [Mycolicibacter senuensis]RAV03882.1 hypothetical protein DQP56_01410 [Mycolicibacter senuensis]